MTKMMRAAAAVAILTSGMGSVGCVGAGASGRPTLDDRARNVYDPCYPERYNHAARQAVLAPFAQQVHNGQVLNQTIFTYYFETGSDKLTSAGVEKLDSIARTRPAPDPKLYLQTAMDVPVTDATAGKITELRADLDAKRAAAVQKYLATVPSFAPVSYEIFVHNPATPGINAEFSANPFRSSGLGYRGGITGMTGTGGAVSTGATQGTSLSSPAGAGGGTGAVVPR
ncbi:hypothetical protein VT84_32525 [Gemmata sp. SH-PL17]|uniref:hypothetical protein n=1 Tax=Gemmata sp. SH-PL17 TaxID=1630693 RepID=UPI0004B99E2E|nr:hypothetical protein [Gemmata sp. SH-PL17]AMV29166.1 hypothetical protein VT84_32525 [Gemmata sp. SH-PL17]